MTIIELPDREIMEDADALEAWSMNQFRCAACYKTHVEASALDLAGLSTHHIVKRSRRLCHLPWNLLRLCMRCHECAEGSTMEDAPPLSFEACLGIKSEGLLDEWRPDMLAELWGYKLPEIEKLPEFFQLERNRRERLVPWRSL